MKVLFTERQREFKKARPLTGFMCTTVKLLYILLGSVISKVYDKRFAIFIFIRPLIENSGSNFYPVYGRPLSIMAQSIPSVPIPPPPPAFVGHLSPGRFLRWEIVRKPLPRGVAFVNSSRSG